MSTYPLLSLAIWIPIVSGLVVLTTGSDRNAPLARMLAHAGTFRAMTARVKALAEDLCGGRLVLEVHDVPGQPQSQRRQDDRGVG